MRTQATEVMGIRTVKTPSSPPFSNSLSMIRIRLPALTSPTHVLWRSLEWRARRTTLTLLSSYTQINQRFTNHCTWLTSLISMAFQLPELTSVKLIASNLIAQKMLGMFLTSHKTLLISFLLPPTPALPQLQATCRILKLAKGRTGLLSWTTIRAAIHFNFNLCKDKFKVNCKWRSMKLILLAVQSTTLSQSIRLKLQQLIRRLLMWQQRNN